MQEVLKVGKEDFEIRQSFKFAANNYESVILKIKFGKNNKKTA